MVFYGLVAFHFSNVHFGAILHLRRVLGRSPSAKWGDFAPGPSRRGRCGSPLQAGDDDFVGDFLGGPLIGADGDLCRGLVEGEAGLEAGLPVSAVRGRS